MLYFAYGSNLSTPRLRERVPSARLVGVARLARHRLVFHKLGLDGSAKCDVVETGGADECVHGAVFELGAREREKLDAVEGVGRGYAAVRVEVELDGGTHVTAWSYRATRFDAALRPFRWYRLHVLAGAREHGLPLRYRAAIRAVEAVEDPDTARAERELSIYGRARPA